jgi:tetratricopeptide (TPR) repeat protein
MGETTTAQELKKEGLRLFHEGLYDEAAANFEQAKEMFITEGNDLEAAEMVNNLGVIYRAQDKWDQAIAALEEARAAFVKLGDRNREAQTLGNLGGLYAEKRERDKAKECLRQAADIFAEIGDKDHQGETLVALAEQQMKTGEREAGIATYMAGVQLQQKPTLRQKAMRGLFGLYTRLLGGKQAAGD